MKISPLAGKKAEASMLVDVPRLVSAYYTYLPDPDRRSERIAFGTSGHRGSSFEKSFNERHILAVSQAICFFREHKKIKGPLYLGIDTHALSVPAMISALEVLAANNIEVIVDCNGGYTPTPVVSHAILTYNRNRTSGFADGILITPSHNPPEDGGFKYNPPNGGPADPQITGWIEMQANEILQDKLRKVKRIPYERAVRAPTIHRHDYLDHYTADLENIIDLKSISDAGISIGADPLGGASVKYWGRIADHYGLNLSVVNSTLDPTFHFVAVDWDGRIRMDPSSRFVMQNLIERKEHFDIAFACDADADRHGIVTRKAGLMNPNHFIAVAVFYLFQNRPGWDIRAAVGKTVVSSRMINLVAEKIGRTVYETPVGFKWFVEGLLDGSLGFGGEESAGASFLRMNGSVWTTDKDGIIPALLAAEITAKTGRDPGEIYREFTNEFGEPAYDRVEAPATLEEKENFKKLTPDKIKATHLAGEKIKTILAYAPGNDEPIGGLKVETKNGWCAVRPSGTEDIYKIYAESFRGRKHLRLIQEEARKIVGEALA
ncbi:MAG: phosphoglucomutase (alpha-D-glucose-1,6-bisphosphate-dependent) [Syntrophales bacterium]|jgi:phosphoglucomutase|nr:phosphoglucomutase (alpha-D-glucose-1,6-bisphosphate-dependent) [Syntrophales bacterium]MDY0043076.1 phosphoglucomutase (alpha-D-glucose-1,6-bisphosphate-dependent) [Syntrophales bacterium]